MLERFTSLCNLNSQLTEVNRLSSPHLQRLVPWSECIVFNFHSTYRLYIFHASSIVGVASNILHLDQFARVDFTRRNAITCCIEYYQWTFVLSGEKRDPVTPRSETNISQRCSKMVHRYWWRWLLRLIWCPLEQIRFHMHSVWCITFDFSLPRVHL